MAEAPAKKNPRPLKQDASQGSSRGFSSFITQYQRRIYQSIQCMLMLRKVMLHLGGAPEEVGGGGAGEEEHEAVEAEGNRVPERVEGAALNDARAHVPAPGCAAVEAVHHHRDHAAHLACAGHGVFIGFQGAFRAAVVLPYTTTQGAVLRTPGETCTLWVH